jgi:hypothetical protein
MVRPLRRARSAPATVALACLTLASAAGFGRIFATGAWAGPVIVTILAAHAAAAAGRWRRLPAVVVLAGGAVVTGLVGVYLVMPGHLSHALPLGGEWAAVHRALAAAVPGIHTLVPPVPARAGFVLLAAWVSGVAAVVGDWLAFRLGFALAAIVPGATVFTITAILGTIGGRTAAVMLEVVAALAFLAAHQATVGSQVALWFGNRRRGARRWATSAGVTFGAVALLGALVVAPLSTGTEGNGTLGWRGAHGSSGDRITPNPLDQLRTRLLQESDTPVMTVKAGVASYWRLTSLDTFNGYEWQADHAYQSFGTDLPGVPRPAKGVRLIVDQFHIQNLDSIWVPSAFDPVAVEGGTRVTWDPVSGSLISAAPTSNGQTYKVVAEESLAGLRPGELARRPPPPASIAGRYTQLPPLPADVVSLARSITAGARTEYGKAYALEQYFHGPQWTYSTDPPADDSVNALTAFLFDFHTGFCQQYAGSYAVLARVVGLPTRVAVGFQEGKLGPGGIYQVTDADAHAWPEVYFSGVGWVPFEPTPGRQVPGAAAYTGSTGFYAPASSSGATVPPAAAAPPPVPAHFGGPTGARPTAAQASRGGGATAPVAKGSSVLVPVGLAAAALAGALALWMGATVGGRRWRWRRRRRRAARHTGVAVRAAWEEAVESLGWWGVRRRPHETLPEFAERGVARLAEAGCSAPLRRALVELAGLVQELAFAPPRPGGSAGDTDTGGDLAGIISTGLWRAASPSRRLLWALDLPGAWGWTGVSLSLGRWWAGRVGALGAASRLTRKPAAVRPSR